MSMQYELEQKSGKWVVTGRKDAGTPHGGVANPADQPAPENPHGGMGAPPANGGSAMPSPHDLPPVKKK